MIKSTLAHPLLLLIRLHFYLAHALWKSFLRPWYPLQSKIYFFLFPVQNDGGNGQVGAVQQQQQNTFRRGPADLRPSADSAVSPSAANVASGSGGPNGSSTGSVMTNVEFHSMEGKIQ